MASGARKLVLQLLERDAADVPEWPVAVVTSTSPLTVFYRGASLQIRRSALYTPQVNDITMLARSGGNWVAMGPSL